jgi:hypothetical protein
MHVSTSTKRKSFRFYVVASAFLVIAGATAALMAGVTPATAASLASQADTQIAVFMIPLTLLVLAMIYEVARFALRDALPADAPPAPISRPWTPDRG